MCVCVSFCSVLSCYYLYLLLARVNCCACHYHYYYFSNYFVEIFTFLLLIALLFVGVLSSGVKVIVTVAVVAVVAKLVVCGVRGGVVVVSRGVRHFDEYCFLIIQHPSSFDWLGWYIFLVVVPVKSRKGW